MSRLDGNEMLFAPYEGYLLAVTERALGFGIQPLPAVGRGDVELWLPQQYVGRITYANGDSRDARKGASVEAIEMPRWLARENQLIGWRE